MKRVLISAYACAPGVGSEYDVGWQWGMACAQHYDTWVLTKTDNKNDIEKWIEQNEISKNLHFVYVDIPILAAKVKGRMGVLAKYEAWQLKIVKVAKQLHKKYNFEFVHHVTFASVSLPVFLWRTTIPFILGPVGGAKTYHKKSDFRFLSKSKNGKGKELLCKVLLNFA